MMTLTQALDIVIDRTGHERFRFLCSEANPDRDTREGYRALVLDMAEGRAPSPPARSELRTAAQPIPFKPGSCCGG